MDDKVVGRLLEIGKQQPTPDRHDPFAAGPVFVGMTLFIDMKIMGKAKIKASCQLVGYVHGKHLIVTTPEVDGAHVNLSRVSDLIVRYIVGGSVYGFRTELVHSINKPFHMTFLSYPKVVEHVSLRGAPRVQVVIPYESDGPRDDKSQVLNISSTGALIQTALTPELGDIKTLTFTLPNGNLVYKIPATVKRVDITPTRTLAGIHFDSSHADFPLIGAYLSLVFNAIRDLVGPQD